ncbi:MAG: S41 family peptidase [Ruminococcaceae bacterium]|nr:S41 family peptidase [Oscillospiraceae bacterium]
MDLRENYPINNEPDKGHGGEGFKLRNYIAITALLIALAVLLTFIVTYTVLTVRYEEEKTHLDLQYKEKLDAIGEFKSIAELYNALPEEMRNIEIYKKLAYIDYYYRTNYAGEINEDDLVYMIANGYIIGAGDEYGGYYTADEFDTIMNDSEGNSVGIGVYVTSDTNGGIIRVSYVMKDGPANKAGLLPGDIITHVEGQSISELGYYVAIDHIKGEPGTPVKITYMRDGESYEISIIREEITVESVIYSKHETEKDVGIIRIIEFNNSTPAQFKEAVKQAITVDGCKKLVYDLRGNPGGTLTSVIDMLDFLLPSGTVVTVRYADGTKQIYSSDESGEEFEKLYGTDIKMAVLTNGYTASAAELFTCALKDYKKAIIVGENTFGKGCGQSVIPLPDGTGLSFTTFLYDPPVSENYNGEGIEPDVKQELSEEASKKNIFELAPSEDDQLKAALEALK